MNETPTLLSVIINWFPMLLLIGVWVYFMKSMMGKSRGASGKSYAILLEEMNAEMRRQNDLLERIVSGHEARLQRLESGGTRGREVIDG